MREGKWDEQRDRQADTKMNVHIQHVKLITDTAAIDKTTTCTHKLFYNIYFAK